MSDKLKLVEMLLPTIQGEGFHIGRPAIFIRAFGCDYDCRGCDTPYAKKGNHYEYDVERVLDYILTVTNRKPILVVLTGGNPALQDFSELLVYLAGHHYPTSIETQGSISKPWFSDLEYMTLSPKPDSSGNVTQIGTVISCIEAFGRYRTDHISIKVTIYSSEDLEYAQKMFRSLNENFVNHEMGFFVQPFNDLFSFREGIEKDHDLKGRYRHLIETVLNKQMFDVRVLPQLHVMIYGNRRGV